MNAKTLVRTRYAIQLTICGDANRAAQTDVCLLYRPSLILLVLVEDKTLSNRTDAEAQVVAEAIESHPTGSRFSQTSRTSPSSPTTLTLGPLLSMRTRPHERVLHDCCHVQRCLFP
jgi:hypothetical protein